MFSDLKNLPKLKQNIKDLALFLPFSILALFALTRYVGFFFISIYPTIDRTTYLLVFQRTVTSSLLVDHIVIVSAGLVVLYFLIQSKKIIPILAGFFSLEILFIIQNEVALDVFALLMVPSILVIIIASHFIKRKIVKPQNWKRLLYITTGTVFCFEMFVLAIWIAYPFSPSQVKEVAFWYPAILELELFYAFARISPLFIILLSYAFLVKPNQNTIKELFATKSTHDAKFEIDREFIQKNISQLSSRLAKMNLLTKQMSKVGRLTAIPYVSRLKNAIFLESIRLSDSQFRPNVLFSPRVMLAVAIAISLIFVVYPYLPTLNPKNDFVSVDDRSYQLFLTQMQKSDTIQDIIKKSFSLSFGDRPLTLILMHSFQSVFGLSVVYGVRLFPIFLGPGLALAAYFFVREGTGNKYQASYAALLTAFSHQMVVGMYAGFFANWLGLVTVYLSLAMVHKFWEKPSVRNYFLVFIHSILSFLMYIYVDVYLLLLLLIFLVITAVKFRHDSSEKKKVLILSSIFAVYAALFVLRINLGSSELFNVIFAREDIAFSLRDFYNRWINFPKFMHFYVGGYLANTALLAFAFIWTLYAKYEKTFDRILLASLFAGALPFVFGNEVLQSRVFYDVPVQIAAAISIWRILNRKDVNPLFAKTSFALVTIHFAIYALRSLSNLTLVPPA